MSKSSTIRDKQRRQANTRKSSPRIQSCAVLLTLFFASHCSARGATTPFCSVSNPEYKVITPTLIAVHCSENVSALKGKATLYDLSESAISPALNGMTVIPYPGASHWLLVPLASTSLKQHLALRYGGKYKLALELFPRGSQPSPHQKPVTVNLDLNNIIPVPPAESLGSVNPLDFISHIAFMKAPAPDCAIQLEDFLRRIHDLSARCRSLATIPQPDAINVDNIERFASSPEYIGRLMLTFNNPNKAAHQLPYGVPGLVDVFGNSVKIDSKSELGLVKAPSSKDASSYYLNFNYAGGRGSKPGWVLDGKLSPPFGRLHRGFEFAPIASADIGQNQVSGLKYANTVDFGASFNRVFEPNYVLQELFFSPGVTYETDKELDRDNLLATPNVRLNFVGLYNTRERRTLRKYSEELQYAQCKKIPPGIQAKDCVPIPWSMADTKPALIGYALDFDAGLEIGGSLTNTTVKASSGEASLPLPTYPIARLVPKVHGLIEISRFSLDVTYTARFLTAVENTVGEQTNHTLYLQRDHGWFGYAVATVTWTVDPSGHFGLSVSYKDGFSPPTFTRVNTVQSGITLKY